VRPLWSVAEAREAEAASGVPEGLLIDRASTAVARRAAAMLGSVYGARVRVLAGPGHNGADALWAGVKLAERGADVRVCVPYDQPRDAHGRVPLARLRREMQWAPYDLEIDGVFGIGGRAFTRRPRWAPVRRVLAVDLPSGVDADTGAVGGWAVRAEVTVTFGGLKAGLVTGAGAEHAGLVELCPIGIPNAGWVSFPVEAGTWQLSARDVGEYVAPPKPDADKYRRGVVGVVAGSAAYPGAALLACRGAQRAGCGYVRLLAPPAVADAVRAAYPEVVAADRDGDLPRADVWVVGPGLGDEAGDVLDRVLATDVPVVVDADGLRALPDSLTRRAATVLTPHTGEFERLTGTARADAEADRLGAARAAARDRNATVLLKGGTTVAASPSGVAYVNGTGTPWLGTAGTGDVLSGMVGALLLRTPDDPARAAAAAAWLHGLAGRLAAGEPGVAVTALDVAEAVPAAARIALAAC
jgi:hydroxyethylthiazole kinase-like uncharacterized protein yjeF